MREAQAGKRRVTGEERLREEQPRAGRQAQGGEEGLWDGRETKGEYEGSDRGTQGLEAHGVETDTGKIG